MTQEIDFDFIQAVGQEIHDILFNDPDKSGWIDGVLDYFNEQQDFPENTINEIGEYFTKKKSQKNKSIADKISLIIQDEDNVGNLLNSIFFPSVNEEEEEEHQDDEGQPTNDTFEDDVDNTEENVIDVANLSPEEYFDFEINKTMKTLFLSNDIAYALLKKFGWSQSIIMNSWFTKQDEILKSLRIKLGSEMVPNLRSPLSIRECGEGECQFCLNETMLIELYCGHKVCKSCLIDDIKEQILQNKIPLCRQHCSDQLCAAEIMFNDVKGLLNSELFTKYKKVLLRNEIALDPDVKECPNADCDWIITQASSLPCHVGRCPRCYSVVCTRCNQGVHAPLIDCDRINEFTNKISEQMRQLEQDQEAWFKREDRLQEYRKSHMSEVRDAFTKELDVIKRRHQNQCREEQERIDEQTQIVNKIQNKISELSRKLNLYTSQQKSVSDIDSIKREIEDLRKEYDQKEGFKQRLARDKHVNDSERKIELQTIAKEQSLFEEALRDSGMYQRKMYEYEMSMNTRAYQNVSITSNDDDLVSTMTKKCPKCKTPIERNDGCNHMTCQICGYQFCYVCEEPWSTHKNYYVCPKYKKNIVATNKNRKSQCGINFNDMNDKKYYPPPMTVEKRSDFMRWNNLYTQYRMAQEKYDKMLKEYSAKEDQKPDKGQTTLPSYKLCPRNRISILLQDSMNEKAALSTAIKILNTILFAQSIQLWGYPSLYYMMKDPRKARLFEFKLLQMGEQKDKIMELISNTGSATGNDLLIYFEVLDKQIYDVLMFAETF